MAGDRASRQDRAGSGIEPPVAPKVRRAFGLLERVAPAAGARWALELWCTPPAVEMSLRMPPGVVAGEPVRSYSCTTQTTRTVLTRRARESPTYGPQRNL